LPVRSLIPTHKQRNNNNEKKDNCGKGGRRKKSRPSCPVQSSRRVFKIKSQNEIPSFDSKREKDGEEREKLISSLFFFWRPPTRRFLFYSPVVTLVGWLVGWLCCNTSHEKSMNYSKFSSSFFSSSILYSTRTIYKAHLTSWLPSPPSFPPCCLISQVGSGNCSSGYFSRLFLVCVLCCVSE